jgi:hypothetical protein
LIGRQADRGQQGGCSGAPGFEFADARGLLGQALRELRGSASGDTDPVGRQRVYLRGDLVERLGREQPEAGSGVPDPVGELRQRGADVDPECRFVTAPSE